MLELLNQMDGFDAMGDVKASSCAHVQACGSSRLRYGSQTTCACSRACSEACRKLGNGQMLTTRMKRQVKHSIINTALPVSSY